MPQVYNKKRVYRTTFRKLAKGVPYWVSGSLAVAPTVKLSRTKSLGGWNTTTGAPTQTSVADTSVGVVRVPGQFLGQNRDLS